MKVIVTVYCAVSLLFLVSCQKPTEELSSSVLKASVSIGDTLDTAKKSLSQIGAKQVQMDVMSGTGKEPRVTSYDLPSGEVLMLSSGANWNIVHGISLCEDPEQSKAKRQYTSLKKIVMSNAKIIEKVTEPEDALDQKLHD